MPLPANSPTSLAITARHSLIIISHAPVPSSTPPTAEAKAAMKAHLARWESVACAQAQELASMTEPRRLEAIALLSEIKVPPHAAVPGELPYSGLVEQQAIFKRARHS